MAKTKNPTKSIKISPKTYAKIKHAADKERRSFTATLDLVVAEWFSKRIDRVVKPDNK